MKAPRSHCGKSHIFRIVHESCAEQITIILWRVSHAAGDDEPTKETCPLRCEAIAGAKRVLEPTFWCEPLAETSEQRQRRVHWRRPRRVRAFELEIQIHHTLPLARSAARSVKKRF